MVLIRDHLIYPFNLGDEIAVIIQDMQPVFLDQLDPSEADEVIENQQRLLAWAYKHNVPVIFSETYTNQMGLREQPTIEKLTGITSCDPIRIRFKRYSTNAFSSPQLYHCLEKQDVGVLVLAGIQASRGILDTAKGARGYGFSVITSLDIIADNPENVYLGKSATWHKQNGLLLPNHSELERLTDYTMPI